MTRHSRQNTEHDRFEGGLGICEFDYAFHFLRFFVRFKRIFSRHRRCRENKQNRFHRDPQSWKFADENLVFDCKLLEKETTKKSKKKRIFFQKI